MIIGVPRELMAHEGRVAAIPETVRNLVRAGHRVLIESGAGKGSHISNQEYQAEYAEIVGPLDVWKRSDIVLKVKEPQFSDVCGAHEADLLREGRCLIAFLHPASHPDLVLKYQERRLTTISMDCIPRVASARSMDALSSMSVLAGYKAVVVAADHLDQMMTAAGNSVAALSAARVLLVGFGVVGGQALRTAQGLGAEVAVVDVRPQAQALARELGARVVPIDIPSSVAGDRGAKQLPPEWQDRIRDAIAQELPSTDVAILSALVFGERAPVLVTGDMVRRMPPGSIVVDVAVDQGGNCEIVKPGEITLYEHVTVAGIQNLPGYLPVHATQLYARHIANLVLHLVDSDGRLRMDDEIIAAATITHDGLIWHEGTQKALQAA